MKLLKSAVITAIVLFGFNALAKNSCVEVGFDFGYGRAQKRTILDSSRRSLPRDDQNGFGQWKATRMDPRVQADPSPLDSFFNHDFFGTLELFWWNVKSIDPANIFVS